MTEEAFQALQFTGAFKTDVKHQLSIIRTIILFLGGQSSGSVESMGSRKSQGRKKV